MHKKYVKVNALQPVHPAFFMAFFALVMILELGCSSSEITIDNINESKENLQESLDLVNTETDETTEDIETAYIQLKTKLTRKNSFLSRTFTSDVSIKALEESLESMKLNYDNLASALESSKDNGNELFSMLMERAEENTTYKERLVEDIERKKELFDNQMNLVEEVMLEIEKSIQKYDDIVGFFQINTGLDSIDDYVLEVEEEIKLGDLRNKDIKRHITEGLSLVGEL